MVSLPDNDQGRQGLKLPALDDQRFDLWLIEPEISRCVGGGFGIRTRARSAGHVSPVRNCQTGRLLQPGTRRSGPGKVGIATGNRQTQRAD